jgi:hypothetical protein
LVEVLAEWLEKRPVFGKGAQDALRFDHRMVADWQIKAAIVLHRRARFSPSVDQQRREAVKACRISRLTLSTGS